MCFGVSGCKKGDEDPAFTLASRKSRLAATWQMRTGEVDLLTTKSKVDTTEFFRMSVSGITVTTSPANKYSGASAPYGLSLNINKDNTFSCVETIGNARFQATGTWAFNNGNGEYKKKEVVHFLVTNVSQGSTQDIVLFCRLSTTFDYAIVGLESEAMILENLSDSYDNSNGDGQKIFSRYEFESR
jgi:hypothetical protein